MSEQSEFIPRELDKVLARPDEVLPDIIHLIPLGSGPYFPVLVQPVVVDNLPWGAAVKKAVDSPHKLVGLSYTPVQSGKTATPEEVRQIGCVARIHRTHESDGKIQFIAQGIRRFKIIEWIDRVPPFLVRVEYLEPVINEDADQLRAYAMSLISSIKELATLNPLYTEELKHYLNYFTPNEPSALTDFAAAITSAQAEDLQDVLETVPLLDRMEKVLLLVGKELELARLQDKITQQVQDQVDDQQREFFLKQQLKAIQQELGIAKDDKESDVEVFTERFEKLRLPEKAKKAADAELKKLQVLDPSAAEYGVTRNYLDWLSSVPWGIYSDDQLDLTAARKILNRDHDGLDDVKERIIEFLAIGAYRGEVAGSILLLVGPPGVGKTSIGKSIANALGRSFYRFSLGGMRDEAEIKGHRRTYIGAMPGKLVQALKEVEVQNPVIMLDEIDKIGASFQGDPASALLEVLDPEQNGEFLDHYLDLRVDLSKVLFICTANQLDTIPAPLLDRMETIRLSGYLTDEKLQIARHHLWPRQLRKAGLKGSKLKITDGAIRMIVDGYAREAGVRGLDKLLGRIVRKSVVRFLQEELRLINVSKPVVEDLLGAPIFRKQQVQRGIGVVNGLAWTALGGTTLAIEAQAVHLDGRGFKQTGQLGDVMQESAQIAYSHVAGHASVFGAEDKYFDNTLIHLHVPEGATPKDGPSAGVTMATALVSLARRKQINRDIAMTGELTLTGRVLPVGGIREKIIAARRAGIRELILPHENLRDYDEMPDYLKTGLKLHFVRMFEEIVPICFG
ncbi:MAG: endopeptidase La [Pseudomonadota bacterium]|nr:endopeptidase La [Pseudomonadota bacterium]